MNHNLFIIIIILQLFSCSNSKAYTMLDSTIEHEKKELIDTYFSFHQILWNYKNTPDSTLSNFIIKIKEKILLQNQKEYLFFVEELGRLCDGGTSEELSDAVLEIYKIKTSLLFDYIIFVVPQNNYLTDLLLNSIYLNIEQSPNPRETMKNVKKFFKESIKPFNSHKHQMKRLEVKFKLFEQKVNKFISTST